MTKILYRYRWEIAFYGFLACYLTALLIRTAGLPLHSWDESRNVMNAYEMVKSGDWIAMTFGGALDEYNPKPPLYMWMMALLFRFFGYSEVAVRLPSVIFGLGTGALIFHFLRGTGVSRAGSMISSIGLITSTGFYGHHAMTSGDVDIALCFFNLLSFIAIQKIFIENRPKWYLMLGASTAFGFLTKSIVGLVPAILIPCALALNFRWKNLKTSYLGLGIAAFIVLTLPWLAARQLLYRDDYLSKILLGSHLIEPMTSAVDGHSGSVLFYIDCIFAHLGKWVFVAGWSALSLVSASLLRQTSESSVIRSRFMGANALCCAALFLIYLCGFSLAKTKVAWYILPAYPVLFLLIGFGWHEIEKLYSKRLLHGLGTVLLLSNLANLHAYESRRNTGVPLVDHLLFPMKGLIWHKKIITQGGEFPQNAMVLSRVYSDLNTVHFQKPVPVEYMLKLQPEAEFLFTSERSRYEGDPLLRLLSVVTSNGQPTELAAFVIEQKKSARNENK